MKTKGYTLAETIVYASIVAILFFVVANTLIVLMRLHSDSRSVRSLQESGLTAVERISREIRGAKSVNLSSSVLNSHPGTLILNVENADDTESAVGFSLSDGTIRVSVNGVDQGPLTKNSVSVSNLIFRQSDNESSELVKVEITMSSGDRTESFYTSVILRDSYAQ